MDIKLNNVLFTEEFWTAQWDNLKDSNTKGKTKDHPAKDDTYKVHKGFTTPEYWDSASQTYNTNNEEIAGKKTDKIINLLKDHNLIFENCTVLEIGCGTGLFARELAKNNCNVTALDFSKGMIGCCKKDLPKNLEDRINFFQQDWNKIDLEEIKWTKKFDLVAAFMCPAISTPESFLKMMGASKNGCIIKGWAKKREHGILDDLWKILMNSPLKDNPQNFLYKLNFLFSMGYFPEVTFDTLEWEEKVELEKELQTQFTFFRKISDKDDSELKKIIINYLNTIEVNSLITKKHKGLTGTAYWRL